MPLLIFIYLFCDWAVDMQIKALLTRSQCRVSDNQVTDNAHGPLVTLFINILIMIHKS